MAKPHITMLIAAISPNPAKPPEFFAGWSSDRHVCKSKWTQERAEALTFTALDEAVVEAALLQPGWRSRLIQPVPILMAH